MKSTTKQIAAPDFTLPDQAGKMHSLHDYRGSWVVLYFYPKDDTPGCTTQACDIRDKWSDFKDLGVSVLGISPDTVESHAQFAQKYSLPFTILADPEKKVIDLYGAWQQKISLSKVLFGLQRSTVIISPEGKIVKSYKKVNEKTHAEKVFKDLLQLMRPYA